MTFYHPTKGAAQEVADRIDSRRGWKGSDQ